MGLGLFRPTKVEADIVIYSKRCASCLYPEEMLAINYYASEHGLTTQVIRTVYRPADHERAMELWATRRDAPQSETPEALANYPTFVVYKNIMPIKDFIEVISKEQLKNKQIGGITDDMQGQRRAKGPSRKNCLANSILEARAQTKE